MRKMVGVAVALALTAGTAAVAQMSSMNPPELKWGPAPPAVPPGAQFAVLSGDPTKPGPFVIRVKMPAGYAVAPHRHPKAEFLTVIEGDLRFGMGEVADKAKAKALTAGGFAVAHAEMNHYVSTDGGATLQVQSEGPFTVTYVNPADDPRSKAG